MPLSGLALTVCSIHEGGGGGDGFHYNPILCNVHWARFLLFKPRDSFVFSFVTAAIINKSKEKQCCCVFPVKIAETDSCPALLPLQMTSPLSVAPLVSSLLVCFSVLSLTLLTYHMSAKRACPDPGFDPSFPSFQRFISTKSGFYPDLLEHTKHLWCTKSQLLIFVYSTLICLRWFRQ